MPIKLWGPMACLVCALFGWSFRVPSDNIQQQKLQVSSSRVLNVSPFSTLGEAECDASGDAFYRVPLDLGHASTDSRIVEIPSGDGDPKAYRLGAEQIKKAPVFIAFTVTQSGEVWLLNANWHSDTGRYDYDIFGFGADGDVATAVVPDLPADIRADEFAVSRYGTFLIGGFSDWSAPKSERGKRFEGIFDKSGRLASTLEVGGTVDLNKLGPGKGMQPPSVVWAPDENLYFLHSDRVTIVAPDGESHSIPFEAPDKDSSPVHLSVSDGWISIELATENKETHSVQFKYLVLNMATDTTIGVYLPTADTGKHASCFSRRNGYTFLKHEGSRTEVITAR